MAIRIGAGLRSLIAAAVVAVAAFATTGHAQQLRNGGSLSILTESDLPTLDPTGFASFNDREAGIILYDTLLDIDLKERSFHTLPRNSKPRLTLPRSR